MGLGREAVVTHFVGPFICLVGLTSVVGQLKLSAWRKLCGLELIGTFHLAHDIYTLDLSLCYFLHT